MTNEDLQLWEDLLYDEQRIKADNHYREYIKLIFENVELTDFHNSFYDILDRFVKGNIRRLIISVPPQHGKSTASTVLMVPYLLGRNPDNKIAVLSYSSPFAQKFNRDIKRIISEVQYKLCFEQTRINEKSVVTSQGWKNTQEEFEVIEKKGRNKAVGVGGSLTGETVDILIMDDLYKDFQDANSPIVSQRVWDWFITVAKTRLHNDSQELMTFTRWSDDDIIGRLEKAGEVINISDYKTVDEAIDAAGEDKYLKVNYEAIKSGAKTCIDTREEGQPLFPSKHSLKKLEKMRKLDPSKFSALFQGQPRDQEGLLYTKFKTYKELPELKERKSFTDYADEGTDFLCTIGYGVPLSSDDPFIYILDVYFTQKSVEVTEKEVVQFIERNDLRKNKVESNGGGKGFEKAIKKKLTDRHTVEGLNRRGNKESRINSNSGSVQYTCLFPFNWEGLFPEFSTQILNFKKIFKANKHDDSADCLTAVYEEEKGGEDFFAI